MVSGTDSTVSSKKPGAPSKADRRWHGFFAVSIGLGFILAGVGVLVTPGLRGFLIGKLGAPVTPTVPAFPCEELIALVTGLTAVIAAIVAVVLGIIAIVLGLRYVQIRDLQWVEWVLLLLISGVVAGILLLPISCLRLPAVTTGVELPIPADKLTGGTGPLAPGQVVEIVASVPDASGTPVPQTYTGLEVLAVVDDNGTVLVTAPHEVAANLQNALTTDKALFTYRLLSGRPTPTIAPTATVTPTLTPPPSPDTVYLEIDIADLQPRPIGLVTGTAQLVVVEKLEVAPMVIKRRDEPEAATVAVSAYADRLFCVEVEAFLNQDGLRQDRFDAEDTKQVLIQVPMNRLADVARSLAGKQSIWLVNVRQCTESQ